MKKILFNLSLSFLISQSAFATSSPVFSNGTLTVTDPDSNIHTLTFSCENSRTKLVDDTIEEDPSNPGNGLPIPVVPVIPGLSKQSTLVDVNCDQVKRIVVNLVNNSSELSVDFTGVTKKSFPLLTKTKVILGSNNDIFYGSEVSDEVSGKSGNDTLYGRSGNDILSGSSGNDIIYGEAGQDTIHGDSGNDTIYGGAGSDKLYGDSGNDIIYGSKSDSISGGSGKNTIRK